MDSNSRPSGGDPTAAAAAAAAGADPIAIPDWRSQLSPEARQRILTKIMETLKRHLPVPVPGLNELQKIAVRFEEKIYSAAISQPDYLRKISLKMLTMEAKTQGPQINPASNPNLQNPNIQNLQNPNRIDPGLGAMQASSNPNSAQSLSMPQTSRQMPIPQTFQSNSANQSMPAVTQQPPAGSMTSLSQPPAGSMNSLQSDMYAQRRQQSQIPQNQNQNQMVYQQMMRQKLLQQQQMSSGSGAMQIPQNFQLNSTNQSMPAGTQLPAGGMTSLSQPPAGSMTSLTQPPAGMISLAQPPTGMQSLTQPPTGMNPLAQPPPGTILLAQQQMMRQNHLSLMSSGLTGQPNMTAGGMTQNQLNLLQQQQYLLPMHLKQIQQFQMMNMNNNNNMMVQSGGNNVNNNMNNMQLRGMQQMSWQNLNQQPIQQQGLNCNNNNNNNNNNMMLLQQHQRSVGMLQTQNSGNNNNASMDSTAQKGAPSKLEVVCQKQQILPQTVSTGTMMSQGGKMMSQGGMMMSQPNKGLKQQQKLIKQNLVEVHELGLWVNPAAKILVLLVIILFLLHAVHELGFCVINM